MFEELFDLVKVARDQGWLDGLLDAVRTKHRILITGETGVGKTQLRRSLTDLTAAAIGAGDRTRFPVTERIRIAGQLFDFIDMPGQMFHGGRVGEELKRGLDDGYAGVLNVVCYGYHEFEAGRGSAIDPQGRVDQEFLVARREGEMNQLDRWQEVRSSGATPWIITVVTKADLWWPEWPEIRGHYEHGGYADRMRAGSRAEHQVVPYLSVFHKFYGIVPLSGHVDDEDRRNHRSQLFRTLLEAIGKGHLPRPESG